MNKFFLKKLNRKKSLRCSKGFSLVETLMTVLLLLVVSSLAAMAISFGTAEYRKSMNQSLAQMLYSSLETALESHLQYADATNSNYILQDGMLYLEAGSERKPVLKKVAYTGLTLDDFKLSYNSSSHYFNVSFSVCSGNQVLIDGNKNSFDVFSLPSMLMFSVDGNPKELLVKNASTFTGFLNVGSDSFEDGFTWLNNWGVGYNYSLGKALVSGRGNDDIKNALRAQGNYAAANKAYIKVSQNEDNKKLKNQMVSSSGFDLLYGSFDAYTILAQTKDDMDSVPQNGTFDVTEYLVVQGQSRKNSSYPSDGYAIIGVRETTINVNNNGVVGGHSYNKNDWIVVSVDSNTFKK